jgi:4-methylaminobutanoate oxidase (formaldehyde-forming)
MKLPSQADVVIVGGGIIGCAIAYHLSKVGVRGVVLLERKRLTSGTTWHAAGMIGRMQPTQALADLAKFGIENIRLLEEETEQVTGFKQNGGYTIALSEDRLTQLRRTCALGQHFGVRTRMVTPEELKEAWPLLNTDGIRGAIHFPETGQINPVDYTMAFAKGAQRHGASIFENTKVDALVKRGSRVIGVETTAGLIEAKTVVLACGMWTRGLARTIGVHVPLQAVEHAYIVTEPIPELDPRTSGLMIPEERSYYKEDAGKLLVGFFEESGNAWLSHGIPENFEFDSLPENYEHFERELTAASGRVPRLGTAGIKTFFVGPESFTADGRYLVGPAPEVQGLFISAGYNSSGIMSSAGMGKVVAEWIAKGNPPVDMHAFALTRNMPFQANRHYIAERSTETIGVWANIPWAGRQMMTGRGVRRMPLYNEQKAEGAYFGDIGGLEIPLWYANKGPLKFEFKFGKQDWYPILREESLAIRDDVGLIDQSGYGKFLVTGRDAVACLNRICAADVDVPAGKVVYTAWLNEEGGFEADLTVTRLSQEQFLIVTGFSHYWADLNWLSAKVASGAKVTVQDVSSAYGILAVMGPKSRSMLQSLSDDDLSNEKIPFGWSASMSLGHITVRATRVTFVGELGYELMIPADMCGYAHDLIAERGKRYALRRAGLFTVNACRLERGYRLMGIDMGADDTPLTAGLGFAVSWKKADDFIGRAALEKARGKPVQSRLLQFALRGDDVPVILGSEVIWRNGKSVGTTTSGSWGFRVDRSLGMGYVNCEDGVSKDWVGQGQFQIDFGGTRFAADAQLASFYDPLGERTRM